jgi:hypothetical protein
VKGRLALAAGSVFGCLLVLPRSAASSLVLNQTTSEFLEGARYLQGRVDEEAEKDP